MSYSLKELPFSTLTFNLVFFVEVDLQVGDKKLLFQRAALCLFSIHFLAKSPLSSLPVSTISVAALAPVSERRWICITQTFAAGAFQCCRNF